MQDFLQHRADYLAKLTPFSRFLPYQTACYNPYPLVLDRTLYQDLRDFTAMLMQAIAAITENYLRDEAMQKAMPLSQSMRRFLQLSQAVPYRPGTMRPDLLFGAAGEVKVCEINARFPLNGMAISQWLTKAALESEFLNWQHYEPIAELAKIQSTILARFSTDIPLVRVASSESGSESLYFLETFTHQGGQVLHVKPENLRMQSDQIFASDGNTEVPVNQFILEIDREELSLFSEDVITHIIEHSNYINDVRTLILVHDKRILSLLANEKIMSAYLRPEQLSLLNRFLTQSLDLSDDQHFQEVSNNKDNWVIKKVSGGRGVDLYVGQQCDASDWRERLTKERGSFMAQQFVAPGAVPLVTSDKSTTEIKPMHFVGSLPCFDGECFGLGMFRASEKLCVNIGNGQGQSILLPSAVSRVANNLSQRQLKELNHLAWQASV